MLNPIQQMLLNKAKQNPNIANNPIAQQQIAVLERGDPAEIQQLATDICQNNGTTPQEVIPQLRNLFQQNMGNLPFQQ